MTAAMMIRCFNQCYFYRYANKQRCVQETSPASKLNFFIRRLAEKILAQSRDERRISSNRLRGVVRQRALLLFISGLHVPFNL
jgi:hypothetical protein